MRATLGQSALWAMAVLLPAAGCEKANWEWWKQPAAPSQPAQAQDPNARPLSAEEAAALRADNELLRRELAELRARERRLAEDLKDLKFLSDQQVKQIEALADAPAERDRWKQKADQLQADLQRVRTELELLKYGRAVSHPRTAPAPSTGPDSP